MINNEIVAIGLQYERQRQKCNNKIPENYWDIYSVEETARVRRAREY